MYRLKPKLAVYLVTGRRAYREHNPGETFEANLEEDVVERAVRHGTIRVLDPSPVAIKPGSWRPPRHWETRRATDAPNRGVSFEGS